MKCNKGLEDSTINTDSIYYIFSEIKLRIIEYIGLETRYFDIRHLYGRRDRQTLDKRFIKAFENIHVNCANDKTLLFNIFRYKYLKFKYRSKKAIPIQRS